MTSSEEKIGNKKRTIYLNRDLDKDIRVAAAKEDKSVSAIVDEALRMYLKAKKSSDKS
jgi:predicted HicB family RNase H-like nuclease